MMHDVVVVGAGILGSSIAYHAARAGAAVTILDAGRPGAGVTADSFAWIASSGTHTGPAGALRATATAEYRRLEAELPGLPVTWSGVLTWGGSGDPPEAGPEQEIVDAATIAKLEPKLLRPPEWAVWTPGDGAVDSVGVVERLVEGARAHGARVHANSPVIRVVRNPAGHIAGVETAIGLVSGATVVLAAGVGTAALAASVGVDVPVSASPCPLMRFRGPADLVRTVISNPDFDLRQVSADRLIAAADSPELALAALRSSFRGAAGVELLSTRIGQRPMPADGEPIIGPVDEVPGLYVAVTHAAVTLAPALGRLIAREILDGTADPLLAESRLTRDF